MTAVDIRTWAIGPAHDPYGAEETTVTCGGENNHRMACWYFDGLGRNRLELWEHDQEAGERVVRRKLEWNDVTYTKDSANKEALARILFRRWVGISCDEARTQYEHIYSHDPMGPLSRYV